MNLFRAETPRSEAACANYTDRAGADVLKARIESYWSERGFDVQVMLVDGPFTPALRAARIDVRSELINGLPRESAKRVSG